MVSKGKRLVFDAVQTQNQGCPCFRYRRNLDARMHYLRSLVVCATIPQRIMKQKVVVQVLADGYALLTRFRATAREILAVAIITE